jgi:deoxycytidylate deaminase
MPNFDRLVEIARALKLNKQSGVCFHVSFLLKGRKVVAIGINSYTKQNTISLSYKPTRISNGKYIAGIHSEMAVTAAIKFSSKNQKFTLVNVRINNNNKVVNSTPCANCSYQLGKMSNINKIFHSTECGTFVRFP